MNRFFYAALILAALCLNSAAQTKAAQQGDSDEKLANALVHWDTECGPKGCMLQTEVLRGYSDDPPDPKDFREYVGIYVPVDRATLKPAYFAFHVDPRASQDNGIFITFSKTARDGDSWTLNLDPKGPSRLMFDKCNEKSCVVRVAGGLVHEGNESHEMSLLDKFLNSDHLLILYLKDGKAYRTMVLLSSFKTAYQRLLANELAPKNN
jgi:hypothetical protein